MSASCSAEMTKFHKDKIVLSADDQADMRVRRNAGRSRLKAGLERDGHPLPVEQQSQGSYAMKTMVQDPQADYDIDDGIYFQASDLKDKAGASLTPLAARQRVAAALKDDRLKHDAQVKNNCVRQPYPEGYHIDLPVYRIAKTTDAVGKEVSKYQLASGDNWFPSDARGVTDWYKGKVGTLNSGAEDGSQLRRVTRLTKAFARSRIEWKKATTSGICLTKLVVDHFVASADGDDASLRATWVKIAATLAVSTKVDHPVGGRQLAAEGDAEVNSFRENLNWALKELQVLNKAGCTSKEARAAWDKVFNTTFFSDQPTNENADDDSGSKGAPFVVTSNKSEHRDDGGRRFG